MIKIIDQNGKFNQELKQIPNSSGNIAIFGSQSSGKSTLINSAFNTHFPVMDSKQQRKRCTKGVWLQNNNKYNIIDTQGFDSVQRNKNQRIIQRQIALFCLAISDVVIVNIWMNQIGRYQGGQIHILKAIINAANYLIQSQTKTLLFVIKDCDRNANHQILKQQLQNQVNGIIAQCSNNNKNKGTKSLKFNMEYYFMSHYIYNPQQYDKQAKKLSTLIKIKKSSLNTHQAKDRIVYLQHLWQTIIANQGQIDLRQQQQAIRSYVINRIRKQSQQNIIKQIQIQTRIGRLNSYQRMYQHYVKRGFQQIKLKIPKYVDQKIIKQQFCLLQQQLQYYIQKHFTQIILPNQQQYILKQFLQKQLQKSINTLQLQKIIIENRKKVLQLYKLLIQGHKQSQILINRFAQKITQKSINFQIQVSHLFNIFQIKLQSQINKQLDKQVTHIKFNGIKINNIFKKICKQFQYNQWQVNIKQIYQRSIHRTLILKLPQSIQSKLLYQSTSTLTSIFSSDNQINIISQYKNIEKKIQNFIKQLLKYFEEQDNGQQYIQISKQKLRQSLEYALNQQRKRFRISMLMLGIFLIFCYGEFMFLLKYGGIKKKMRRNLSNLYIAVVGIIVIGSIIKRVLRGHAFIHPNVV